MAAGIEGGDRTGALRGLLAAAPMSRLQIIAVALSIALNALDGFDVLAATFAAPGISAEWRISPAALGVALSSGLAGMAAGSLLLAPAGDRVGRRPLILFCLLLMTGGMFLTATATGLTSLCLWRAVTGVGIGGMLAAINAVAAEFANEKRRDLSVALMTVGYPAGGLIGGFAVAGLVEDFGWRSIFLFGGVVTALFVPLIWLFLPESLEHLSRQRSARARATLDGLLRRMGHAALDAALVETPRQEAGKGGARELFGPVYRRMTILLILAYFLHISTFYFFSGWLPKLISDIGYSTPDAIRTSAIMSLGGVLGGALLGWMAPKLGLKRLVVAAMIGTSVTMAVFGNVDGLATMQRVAFAVGLCVFGGIVGLYASLARAFPARMRVTGTGLAIGLGRGGAVIGPIVGGLLLQAGLRMGLVLAVVGLCALAGAIFLVLAPKPPEEH